MSKKVEQAISDMRRQLRAESKSELIRTWLLLYAQKVNLEIENEMLRTELNKTAAETAQPSGGTNEESDSSIISAG